MICTESSVIHKTFLQEQYVTFLQHPTNSALKVPVFQIRIHLTRSKDNNPSEKLTAPQLHENLSPLYETLRFITLCKNPPLFTIFSQINPVHALCHNSDFFKMHLSCQLSLGISSSLFCFGLPYQNPVCFYFLLHTVTFPHPSSLTLI